MSLRLLQPIVAAVVQDVVEEAAEILEAATVVVPITEIIILVKINNKISIRTSSRVRNLTRRALRQLQTFPPTRVIVTGMKAETQLTAAILLSAAGPT